MSAMTFTAEQAVLKSVRHYENVSKGSLIIRNLETGDDGQLRARFVASRQITFLTPEMIAFAHANLAPNCEYVVNVTGYETSTPDKKIKDKWYENKIVSSIEIIENTN
tara:strand:+ start:534 stop:857 length:324 start_codon:yes stop_codon:yes gene_type:complete